LCHGKSSKHEKASEQTYSFEKEHQQSGEIR
jgi:hypothetical protein